MKLLIVLLCTGIGLLWGPAFADEALPELPFEVPDKQWRPLRDRADLFLQQQLSGNLNARADWARLIKQGKLAVALVDLHNPVRPRYARVNGSTMMYAASLPKIAILLAAVDALESGQLELDESIDKDLTSMIRTSSNAAATRMIDRLGGLRKVNAVLTDPRFNFYDADRGGGLWVGKRYAKLGRRLPDPVNGISHGATATQVARYYYRMAAGRLISREGSARMLSYLSDPALNHKFVKILKQESSDIKLYRKSGTWKDWHADSVLVWGADWQRYILVALVEDPRGEQIMQQLVPVAEKTLRQPVPPPVEFQE
jgi:beta-lactamase class A